MNWKRGGQLGAGWVNYNVVPTVDQGYTPGTCSFNLQQDESWIGVDGPGTKREFTYYIERATMKDGGGNTIGTLGFAPNGVDPAFINAGDGHPLNFDSKLPDPLAMTPEARGNPRDYIQFTIGGQSWTTETTTGSARCDTGKWTWDYSPRVSPPPDRAKPVHTLTLHVEPHHGLLLQLLRICLRNEQGLKSP